MPGRLSGKVCFVTGSTGIAEAAAVRFAAEGASVFVASRTEAHLVALARRVEAAGGSVAYRARRADRPGRGRGGRDRVCPSLRPGGLPVVGGRRERASVRGRAGPRADSRQLGSDHRAQSAQPGTRLWGGRAAVARPARRAVGRSRGDCPGVERPRHSPGPRAVRNPRLCGIEGRDRCAGPWRWRRRTRGTGSG